MQLLAMQTSLEPLPHRESSVGRKPFVSQTSDAGSRDSSEPTELNARGSQTPGLPGWIQTSCRDWAHYSYRDRMSVLGVIQRPQTALSILTHHGDFDLPCHHQAGG